MANNEPDISSTLESTSPPGLTTLSSSSLPTLLPPPITTTTSALSTSSLSTIQPSDAEPSKPPPSWARRTHSLETPRLLLRTAKPEDAEAFTVVWRDERNSPFGGVVGNGLSLEEQREKLRSQAASTARGENGWMVVLLKPHLQDILDSSGLTPPELKALQVTDGYLIGMTGYNTFSLVPRKVARQNPNQISSEIPTQNKPKPKPEKTEEILETDTGTLTHHPFTHNGLGMETLQAVISYAFTSLGVESVTLETASVNTPFTGLMRRMGLGGFEEPGSNRGSEAQAPSEMVEREREEECGREDEVEEKKPTPDHGLGDHESVIFGFSQPEWESAKAGMQERGRWCLD